MSISLEILAALAARPNGEAPVSELKAHLERHAASRERLDEHIRQAKVTGRFDYPILDAGGSAMLFSKGLVDRPRRGVWRITDNGRQYLTALRR